MQACLQINFASILLGWEKSPQVTKGLSASCRSVFAGVHQLRFVLYPSLDGVRTVCLSGLVSLCWKMEEKPLMISLSCRPWLSLAQLPGGQGCMGGSTALLLQGHELHGLLSCLRLLGTYRSGGDSITRRVLGAGLPPSLLGAPRGACLCWGVCWEPRHPRPLGTAPLEVSPFNGKYPATNQISHLQKEEIPWWSGLAYELK